MDCLTFNVMCAVTLVLVYIATKDWRCLFVIGVGISFLAPFEKYHHSNQWVIFFIGILAVVISVSPRIKSWCAKEHLTLVCVGIFMIGVIALSLKAVFKL